MGMGVPIRRSHTENMRYACSNLGGFAAEMGERDGRHLHGLVYQGDVMVET